VHYYKFEIATWHLHTSHLSLIEEAVYFRLINFYYDTETPIPVETQSVIRRLRLTEYADIVASVLAEFFVLHNDGWHQKHCDQKIIEYHGKAKTNKTNGLKGGRPKNQTETQSVNLDNPDKTLIKNKELRTTNKELKIKNDKNTLFDFEKFWNVYDKKVEKPAAEKAWKKISLDDDLFYLIIDAAKKYQAATPDKTYRKNPATWLNGKCWNDEIVVSGNKGYESAKDKSRRTAYEQLTGRSANHESIRDIN
jgi:uncharacterized protein YdaU (DUF1376 family)